MARRRYRKIADPGKVLEAFLGRHEQVWGPMARLVVGGWLSDIGRWAPLVAAIFESRWRLFDPALRARLKGQAEEHGRTPRQEKVSVLATAIYELWYSQPRMPSNVAGLVRMVIAQAEAALRVEEPEPVALPLREEVLGTIPEPEEAAEPRPNLTPLLARLSPAERAFAEHYLAHPGMTRG